MTRDKDIIASAEIHATIFPGFLNQLHLPQILKTAFHGY